jgi:hypothetical protein
VSQRTGLRAADPSPVKDSTTLLLSFLRMAANPFEHYYSGTVAHRALTGNGSQGQKTNGIRHLQRLATRSTS